MDEVRLDGCSLTLEQLVAISRGGAKVRLDEDAIVRMRASRAVVERCVEEQLVRYGITTGFGKFCNVVISKEDNTILQKNLIMSHACGQGSPLPIQTVRAMMTLRANALAVGNSGIRPKVVRHLIDMINADIVPVVPEKGSLGASGDLAPLAHMALVLIGMGEAFYKGERMPGIKALALGGLHPVSLEAKEGLALINGTQAMTAVGALAVYDAVNLYKTASIASALSFQALRGIVDAFDPRIHELRRQNGQIRCAADMRRLVEDSALTTRQGEQRVQDAYVLRCIPQVHGASLEAIGYVQTIVENELNAVTDNPLIFPNPAEGSETPGAVAGKGSGANSGDPGDIISGGNFHGQPIALAMDFLAIACAELANIGERRIERLVNPALSEGLPAFLTTSGGINSGFMIVQYAAAALVSENKVLAHPASVDSIPSSANQEDHVSMGTIAARKAGSIVENAQRVIAMELSSACQALDLRAIQMGIPTIEPRLSPRTAGAYAVVRSAVARLDGDRVMYPDLDAVYRLVADGVIADCWE
ncbi:MAG TPA: histidine ammonia-lyase [Rectinemataceae bacterium]|nr:histidine ammonia-lyase [Rectinemataceae bacterium]